MSAQPQPIQTQPDDQQMVASFASKVRARFPGAYDDLDDSTLAQKVVSKHPEYSDLLPKNFGSDKTAQTLALVPSPKRQQLQALRQPIQSYAEEHNLAPPSDDNEVIGTEGGAILRQGDNIRVIGPSETLAGVSSAARVRAQQAQEENLASVARTGRQRTGARLRDVGYNTAADVAGMASGAVSPRSLGLTAAAVLTPEVTLPILAGMGATQAIEHARNAFRSRNGWMMNPEEVGQSLQGASMAAGSAAGALGIARGQLRTETGAEPTDTAQVIRAGKNFLKPLTRSLDVADRIGQNLGLRVPEAPQALRQAIQPGANIPRAGESIDIAGPRLQQVKNSGLALDAEGNPIKEIKGPADLIPGAPLMQAAKQAVLKGIEDRLGPIADLQADTSPVADAMEDSIAGRLERQNLKVAEAIRARADTYRGNLSIREIEDSIQDANNELRNLYKRSSLGDSPIPGQQEATLAEVKALRTLLDEKVQKLGGADDISDLKREYGALRDVEKASARANAVATRQKGATLWEGLAALRAAGDFASGNLLGAARGAGSIAMGRYLAKLRDPNYLIDKAFQGDKAFDAAEPIMAAPVRTPRLALPPGPTVTPIRTEPIEPASAPPPFYPTTREQRLGLPSPQPTAAPMSQARAQAAAGPTLEQMRNSRPEWSAQQDTTERIRLRNLNNPKATPEDVTYAKQVGETSAEPARMAPAPATKIRPTPRSESLRSYYALPQEARDAVDQMAQGMNSMPQILRDARMEELRQYGGKGTALKERLAREMAKDTGIEIEQAGEAPKVPDEVRLRELNAQMRAAQEGHARARSFETKKQFVDRMRNISAKIQKLKGGPEPK